jgi:hypothetical protein
LISASSRCLSGKFLLSSLYCRPERGGVRVMPAVNGARMADASACDPTEDSRWRPLRLTATATCIVGPLAAEWWATEAASTEIEAKIPDPLSRVVADIEEALQRRSLHDRIAEKLAMDMAWSHYSRP